MTRSKKMVENYFARVKSLRTWQLKPSLMLRPYGCTVSNFQIQLVSASRRPAADGRISKIVDDIGLAAYAALKNDVDRNTAKFTSILDCKQITKLAKFELRPWIHSLDRRHNDEES